LRSHGWLGRSARLPRHVVAGRLVRQVRGWDRPDETAVEVGAQLRGLGHLADARVRELPAFADLLDRGQVLGADDRDHPLLALRDHDLPRLELLAQGHPVEVHVDAGAVARHLGESRREPGRTAVLE
jgi:hypothetical protein